MTRPSAIAAPFDAAAFEASARRAANLLRALSNERRLMILCRLGEGELSVGALQARLGLSQSAISQHLARLRAEGLVRTRRAGQTIYYSIAEPTAVRVVATLADAYGSASLAARD